MRRSWVRRSSLMVALLALGFAALGIRAAASSAAAPVKLRFLWSETSPAQMQFIGAALKEWHAANPDIQVEIIKTPAGLEKAVASIAVGDPYELFDVPYVAAVSVLVANGQLEPIDDIIAEMGGPNAFIRDTLWVYQGHYYAYPYDANMDLWYWRKDLLDAKGLKAPTTWDEWLKVAEALTDKSKGQYGLSVPASGIWATDHTANSFVYGAGAAIVDDNFNVVMDKEPNRTRMIRALEFYKKMRAYMPPGIAAVGPAETMKLYAAGTVASTWYVGRLAHVVADTQPDLLPVTIASPIPSDGGKYPVLNGNPDGWVVTKSKRSKEAKQFLKWLVTRKLVDFQLSVCSHTVPVEKATWTNPKWRESACVKKFWDINIKPQKNILDQLATTGRMGDISQMGTKITARGEGVFDRRAGLVFNSNVIGEMFLRVADKNEAPAAVVDSAAAEIRKLLLKAQ